VTGDPYAVLGVRPDASAEEVRRAYVQLVRRHHPDLHVDAAPSVRAEAEARMRAVNEAWAAVGDAARRRAHDDSRPRPFQAFTSDDDEPDPREQPDVPYRPARPPTTRARLATVAPVTLLGGALGAGALAVVTGAAAAVSLAVVLLALAGVGFVVLPLLALGRARRDEG